MVSPFFTRLLLSVILLSSLASQLLASSSLCCSADATCSGCWMCPGSDLRIRWDDSVSDIHECHSIKDLLNKATCLCNGYSKMAFAWSKGKCCTEYAPTLAAATNLCNLKTWPEAQLSEELFDQAVGDAYRVQNTIWNNDSGYDVPKLSVYVKAYSKDSSSSHSQTPAVKHQDRAPSEDKTERADEPWKQKDTSHETHEAHKEESEAGAGDKGGPAKLDTVAPADKPHDPSHPAETHKTNTYVVSHVSTHYGPHHKVHHKATCSRQQHKCQSAVANQYHQARRAVSHSHLDKRAQSPLPPHLVARARNVDLFKRSETHNGKGGTLCGIDFHGVAYPSQVPETVSQVFAALR